VTVTHLATMRAAALVAPGRIELQERPLPETGAGQVRIRLEGCGVCASNLELWRGRPWFEYPLEPGAPGHEGWGTIDSIGPGVTGFNEGDRVAFLSTRAYSEYDVAGVESLVRLPDSLADTPVPAEPLGCAVNILRRSRIAPGQTVAVVGIGFLGALLTRLVTAAGARVIAITRRDFALEIASRMGAAETVRLDDHARLIEQVGSLTSGHLCQTVIEATGKPGPLDLAAELTAERGTLVIAGYHQDGPRQINMQLWNWRGLDVINAHERDPAVYLQGMRAAVELLAAGKLDPLPLYTHTYTLERLADALDATRDRPDGFLKALVVNTRA
jgi:threonine dehydrogenase-like Zn-dependent dehydrogenase